jgi:DNA-directed RNA polymerase subunit RPC12/RpoP
VESDTVEEALLDLARVLKEIGTTVWVPHWAKAFIEDGVTKARCPECGYVTVAPEFERLYSYVCEQCGKGTRVDNSGLPPEQNRDGGDQEL